jgi:hypothetical protein
MLVQAMQLSLLSSAAFEKRQNVKMATTAKRRKRHTANGVFCFRDSLLPVNEIGP